MLKDLLGDTLQGMLEAEMISHMTDRILPIAREWQNRPLEKKYAIVFMDAVHFHVREDNRTVKKVVYVSDKDRKPFANDLKRFYKAQNEQRAAGLHKMIYTT